MDRITLEELGKLDNPDLAKRMDELLQRARSERYPHRLAGDDMEPYVIPFSRTARFQAMGTDHQRKGLWMVFDFILQMEYVLQYLGLQNETFYRQPSGRVGVASPLRYISYMSLQQASIVGSRIALERMMTLSHFVANTQDLSGGDSAFSGFRDWLLALPTESNWFYLIPYLPWFRKHDDKFRTAEVHSGSKLKKYLLTLQSESQETQNESLILINILSNIWRHLLILSDDKRPNGANAVGSKMTTNWLSSYVKRDVIALAIVRAAIAKELGVGTH